MGTLLELGGVPRWAIEPVLETIPFFRRVLSRSPEELEQLLDHATLWELDSGELLVRRGEIDNCLYFVLKGGLLLFGSQVSRFPVDTVTAGEMYGEAALLTNLNHIATVVADPNCRQTLVLRIDFSPFGQVEDTRRVALETKLDMYQAMENTLHRRLERLATRFPEYSMVFKANHVPPFGGRRRSMEELAYFFLRGVEEAAVLTQWTGYLEEQFKKEGQPSVTGLNVVQTLLGKRRVYNKVNSHALCGTVANPMKALAKKEEWEEALEEEAAEKPAKGEEPLGPSHPEVSQDNPLAKPGAKIGQIGFGPGARLFGQPEEDLPTQGRHGLLARLHQ